MHRRASAPTCQHTTLHVSTEAATGFIDLTDHLTSFVAESGVSIGTLTVQTTHTTTAIVVNEREPLLASDFQRTLERVAPHPGTYAHDDLSRRAGVPPDEPANGHAHCRALLLPTSASLAIVAGLIVLGRWQRVFLVELDGPRPREVSVVVVGVVHP